MRPEAVHPRKNTAQSSCATLESVSESCDAGAVSIDIEKLCSATSTDSRLAELSHQRSPPMSVTHQLQKRQSTILTKGQILQQCASKEKTARIASGCTVIYLSRRGVDYSHHDCATTCLNVVQTVSRRLCEGTPTTKETGTYATTGDGFLYLIQLRIVDLYRHHTTLTRQAYIN